MHAPSVMTHNKTRMNTSQHRPITVGKYLISPLTRPLPNGWIACSVSIRSGSGSATTDRVVRLTRLFRDAVSAAEYAIGEGLQWIGVSRPLAH
jgi:hypothetical protein